MARYQATQTKTLIVEAESAAEAREKAEAVFYYRPGFDKELNRSTIVGPVLIEKER